MKILIIEDEEAIATTLKEELESDYLVDICLTAKEGESSAQINAYDIILLDLGLPDKDGLEVCRKLRRKGIQTPIIVLSGKRNLRTKLSLFDLGADDYITKPFAIKELKARLQAVFRRKHHGAVSNTITLNDLKLDLKQQIVTRKVLVIPLRRKEFHLLEYLVRNAGQIVSRDMILDNVWSDTDDYMSNVVDVQINHLRDKLDKPFRKKLIKTVPGLGYMLAI